MTHSINPVYKNAEDKLESWLHKAYLAGLTSEDIIEIRNNILDKAIFMGYMRRDIGESAVGVVTRGVSGV